MLFIKLCALLGLSQQSYDWNFHNSTQSYEEEIDGFKIKIEYQLDREEFPNQLRWDYTVEEVLKISEQLKIDQKAAVDNVVNVKGPRTFDNTIMQLVRDEYKIERAASPLSFLKEVSTDKEIRDAAESFGPKFQKFQREQYNREEFYHAITDYKQSAEKDGSFAKLDNEQSRLVDQKLRDFKDEGLDLPKETRAQLAKINDEIIDMGQKFEVVGKSDHRTFEIKVSEFEDLPGPLMKALKPVPGKEGYVFIPTGYQKQESVMKYIKNADTRKHLQFQISNPVDGNLTARVEQLIQKRQEKALIQGYSSYVYQEINDQRMAQDPKAVQDFLDDLAFMYRDMQIQEEEALRQFKVKSTGDKNVTYEKWDFAYYGSRQMKERFNQTEEELREYFPVEHVKEVTMEIYQELLGLKFRKLEKANTWYKDVSCYEVRDSESDELMGYFYLDLFPRPDKFNHAAAFPLVMRSNMDGVITYPTTAMVTNFLQQEGEPALLKHQEVVTFFHEFGHVMHGMCTEANFTLFAGTNVEQDFVEMPSQMLENWMWQKEILKKISKHYKTGEPMPDAMIDAKLAKNKVNIAIGQQDQIKLSAVDLLLHSAFDPKLKNEAPHPNGFMHELRQQIKKRDNGQVDSESLINSVQKALGERPMQPGSNWLGSFKHIVAGGYSAGYYSYIWSKVYGDELFAQFLKHGIMNKELGMKYRKIILAPGGSRNSMESLELFLGHKPNIVESLKARGIGKQQNGDKAEKADKGITIEVNLNGADGKAEQKAEI